MTQQIDARVEVPVTHEWEATFHADGTLTADPCPACGAEGFFNVSGTFGAQLCASPGDTDEGEIAPDDLWFTRLTYVWCGECETVVYDAEGRDDE